MDALLVTIREVLPDICANYVRRELSAFPDDPLFVFPGELMDRANALIIRCLDDMQYPKVQEPVQPQAVQPHQLPHLAAEEEIEDRWAAYLRGEVVQREYCINLDAGSLEAYKKNALLMLGQEFPKVPLLKVKGALRKQSSFSKAADHLLQNVDHIAPLKRARKADSAANDDSSLLPAPQILVHEAAVWKAIQQRHLDRAKNRQQGAPRFTCQACMDDDLLAEDALFCNAAEPHAYCYRCVQNIAKMTFFNPATGLNLMNLREAAKEYSPLMSDSSASDTQRDEPKTKLCLQMTMVNCQPFNGGCAACIPDEALQLGMNKAEYSRYSVRSSTVRGLLNRTPNLAVCGGCDTLVKMGGPTDDVVKCPDPACGYEACRWCFEAPHPGISCEDAGDHKAKLEKLVEELFTDCVTQKCPNPRCGRRVEKTSGCNHMRCSCDTSFCWLCGKELNHDDPYSHFRDSAAGGCTQDDDPSWMPQRENRKKKAAVAKLKEHLSTIKLDRDSIMKVLLAKGWRDRVGEVPSFVLPLVKLNEEELSRPVLRQITNPGAMKVEVRLPQAPLPQVLLMVIHVQDVADRSRWSVRVDGSLAPAAGMYGEFNDDWKLVLADAVMMSDIFASSNATPVPLAPGRLLTQEIRQLQYGRLYEVKVRFGYEGEQLGRWAPSESIVLQDAPSRPAAPRMISTPLQVAGGICCLETPDPWQAIVPQYRWTFRHGAASWKPEATFYMVLLQGLGGSRCLCPDGKIMSEDEAFRNMDRAKWQISESKPDTRGFELPAGGTYGISVLVGSANGVTPWSTLSETIAVKDADLEPDLLLERPGELQIFPAFKCGDSSKIAAVRMRDGRRRDEWKYVDRMMGLVSEFNENCLWNLGSANGLTATVKPGLEYEVSTCVLEGENLGMWSFEARFTVPQEIIQPPPPRLYPVRRDQRHAMRVVRGVADSEDTVVRLREAGAGNPWRTWNPYTEEAEAETTAVGYIKPYERRAFFVVRKGGVIVFSLVAGRAYEASMRVAKNGIFGPWSKESEAVVQQEPATCIVSELPPAFHVLQQPERRGYPTRAPGKHRGTTIMRARNVITIPDQLWADFQSELETRMSDIERVYGVSVRTNPQDNGHKVSITKRGTGQSRYKDPDVSMATIYIARLVTQRSLQVPWYMTALLVKDEEAMRKMVELEQGVVLTTLGSRDKPHGHAMSMVSVLGQKDKVDVAMEELQRILNSQVTRTTTIPTRSAGLFIGKCGQNVQRLRDEHHVQIRVSKSTTNELEESVEVVGSQQATRDAIAAINRFRLAQLQRAVPDKHATDGRGRRVQSAAEERRHVPGMKEPEPWRCTMCEEPNRDFRQKCMNCGQPKPEETPKWVCPRCDEPNKLHRYTCNNCGQHKPPDSPMPPCRAGNRYPQYKPKDEQGQRHLRLRRDEGFEPRWAEEWARELQAQMQEHEASGSSARATASHRSRSPRRNC